MSNYLLQSVRMSRKCLRILRNYRNLQRNLPVLSSRKIHSTQSNYAKRKTYNIDHEADKKATVALFSAARQQKKEKDTYLNVIYAYENAPARKTGHVQFIYAAMRYMEEFGVHEDLEVYKAIVNTLPKGKFVCKTFFHCEIMWYPREQQCIIDLLEKMEDNGVIPDLELEVMLVNIFGYLAVPLRKLRRMLYWQGKFKNMNPWPWPKPMPEEAMELAKLAIAKITDVDVQRRITIFDTKDVKDSIDKTWIVSASSPDQERLIEKHPKNVAAYVEGPYKVWIATGSVDYFILRADPVRVRVEEDVDIDDISNIEVNFWRKNRRALELRRSIHEQEEQTILGICATGTSSKDSLLSWIRCLQPRNPALEKIPILFKFTTIVEDYAQIEAGKTVEKANVGEEVTPDITN